MLLRERRPAEGIALTLIVNLGWLQEDAMGFGAGDDNLFRYVGNTPTNATDPSGLVQNQQAYRLIPKTVDKETAGFSGEYKWTIGWGLNQPAGPKGGVILQHIRLTFNLTRAGQDRILTASQLRDAGNVRRTLFNRFHTNLPTPDSTLWAWQKKKGELKRTFTSPPTLDYWEAWYVKKGQTKPSTQDSRGVDDTYSMFELRYVTRATNERVVGTIVTTGQAWYIDGLTFQMMRDKYAFSKNTKNPSGVLLTGQPANGKKLLDDCKAAKAFRVSQEVTHSLIGRWTSTTRVGVVTATLRD